MAGERPRGGAEVDLVGVRGDWPAVTLMRAVLMGGAVMGGLRRRPQWRLRRRERGQPCENGAAICCPAAHGQCTE